MLVYSGFLAIMMIRKKGSHGLLFSTILPFSSQSYKRQFSSFIKEGVTGDSLEKMYRNAHAAIRADPARAAKPAKEIKVKRWTAKRLSIQQRKARVAQKKAAFLAEVGAQADKEDDDDDDEADMDED